MVQGGEGAAAASSAQRARHNGFRWIIEDYQSKWSIIIGIKTFIYTYIIPTLVLAWSIIWISSNMKSPLKCHDCFNIYRFGSRIAASICVGSTIRPARKRSRSHWLLQVGWIRLSYCWTELLLYFPWKLVILRYMFWFGFRFAQHRWRPIYSRKCRRSTLTRTPSSSASFPVIRCTTSLGCTTANLFCVTVDWRYSYYNRFYITLLILR